MIFHPAIFALLSGSLMISAMLAYAACYGIRILKRWDIGSGSELQLSLERRTYLISTMVTYAFGFQLISLFLFIYTADQLHTLFVGAMCAAGALHVNEYGYPAIVLKLINFILAGLWLVVNRTDNRAYDYPLIKKKYLLLLLILPCIVAETIFQGNYFLRLEPDVITSCCGTLFSADAEGVASGVLKLPLVPVAAAFYAIMALNLVLGAYCYARGRGGYLYAATSIASFLACVAALISFLSLYFYELPTHHCPFDILQKEYYFIGYPIYISLLAATVAGLGVGVVKLFGRVKSLAAVVPQIQHRLALTSLISWSIFMIHIGWGVISSNLTLFEL